MEINTTSFAIGCLVQWYECDIIEEYVESLKDAIKSYNGEVIVDFTIVTNEDLEKCISTDQKNKCINKINSILLNFENVRHIQELHTIADYRREFNERYCNKVDLLIWGESDMLVPKQMFTVLNSLHNNIHVTKYLATFGICKMWDDSWKPLEHVDFTNKPFIEGDSQNWWNIPYTMGINEMNTFNDKVEELNVIQIQPHKFNGCGLVISSEVIRSGVNIPNSSFFIHEDTSFMIMTQKILGNIPQYHFKNILMVHNRKHPNKRNYVLGEEKEYLDNQRKSNEWYNVANKMCTQNNNNLFNPNYKSLTWKDVWNSIK
tara:strand:- start:686 stop:1636 length:951 start_codon:yes stop_codon:yes gene_type:complete